MIGAFKAQQQRNGFMSGNKKEKKSRNKNLMISFILSLWSSSRRERILSDAPELTIIQAHLCKNAVLFICGLTNLWPPRLQYKHGPVVYYGNKGKAELQKFFLFFSFSFFFLQLRNLLLWPSSNRGI